MLFDLDNVLSYEKCLQIYIVLYIRPPMVHSEICYTVPEGFSACLVCWTLDCLKSGTACFVILNSSCNRNDANWCN